MLFGGERKFTGKRLCFCFFLEFLILGMMYTQLFSKSVI